jgi:chromosome partitioning protein
MTAIIAFISQKGGVGKSTLARGLSRELAKGGLVVKIADLDTQQGTSIEWNKTRLNNNLKPEIFVESFSRASSVFKIAKHFDIVIIDAPARTSKATLEIAKASDLIIQPSGASRDDLIPAVKEFHALVKEGISRKKLVFALNRIGTKSEEDAARAYINEASYQVIEDSLGDKPAYRQAQNYGHSITETRYKSLNTKTDNFFQSLINMIRL